MDIKHSLDRSVVPSMLAMESIEGGSKTVVKSKANPPWHYVLRALDTAKKHVESLKVDVKFKFNGESCYVINRFALGCIMATRNAEKKLLHFELLPGDWPGSPYLALADHYVHMRSAMSQTRDGPKGLWANRIMFQYLRTWFYDGMKGDIVTGELIEDKLGIAEHGPAHWLDAYKRESPNFPLSAPGAVAREWAYQGMDDGTKDLRLNPTTPQNPPWFAAELKKACNIEA